MSLDKDSNGYIVIFLVVMVLVVAVSLSFVNSGLKPTIKLNEMVDKKTQILKSVVDVPAEGDVAKFVLGTYKEHIEEKVLNSKGEIIESDESAFDIQFEKEVKLPEEERHYPLYIYNGDEGTYYIIPLTGLGLWDKIWGYLAIKQDFETIRGAAFDHKGETPGLGARITEDWFREQFNGKELFDESGDYDFKVLKGSGNPQVATDPHVVDGISGATLTCQGVNAMLARCVEFYEPFFEKTAK